MAVDFALGDYVDVGSGATIDNLWGGGGTIAMWINLDGMVAEAHPVIKGDMVGWTEHWAFLITQTGKNGGAKEETIGFYLNNGGADVGQWIAVPNTLTANIWYHIAMTYNGDAAGNDPLFYVNGVLKGLSQDGNPIGGAFDDSAYSCRAPYPTVDGKVEDLRFYTTVSTADQIATLAAGYRGSLGGEVMWLDMCRAHGITHWDGATLVAATNYLPDGSVNENTGNPIGNPVARASDCPRIGGLILPWGSYLEAVGQPTMIRTQGIPTGPGSRDRARRLL